MDKKWAVSYLKCSFSSLFFTILNLFVVFCCCCCFASFLSTTSGLNLKLFSFSIFHFHVFCFKETDNFFYYISVFSRREKIFFRRWKISLNYFIMLRFDIIFSHFFRQLPRVRVVTGKSRQSVSQAGWLVGGGQSGGRLESRVYVLLFFALSLSCFLFFYTRRRRLHLRWHMLFFRLFSENFFSCVKFCRLLNFRFMNTTRYYF